MNARSLLNGMVVNALTIDVEDYFQVSAFAPHIARDAWDTCRAASSATSSSFSACSPSASARATFFALGWVAERYPALVRRIADAGTSSRAMATGTARERAGLRRSSSPTSAWPRRSSRTLRGRRSTATARRASRSAPPTRGRSIALLEAGYRYSSSIYPIRHDHYGMPDAPRFAHEVRPGCSRSRWRPCACCAQLARRRRRLFPTAALRGVALVAAARERARRRAGDVLFPSMGDRSRAAARRRRRVQAPGFGTTSTCGGWPPACAACSRDFRWASDRRDVPGSARLMDMHADSSVRRRERAGRHRRCGRYEQRRRGPLGALRGALPASDVLPPRRLARRHRARLPPPHALPARRARRRDRGRAAARRGAQPAVRPLARVAAVRGLRRPSPPMPAVRSAARRRSRRHSASRSASTTSSCATRVRRAPAGRRRISTSRSARRSRPMPRRTCWPFRASSGRWCARA